MCFKHVTLQKKNKGYTLMEMVVTVALMAIVMSLAAPPLSDFINNSKLTSTTNNLVSAVILARNEAITRRQTVRATGNDNGWWVEVVGISTHLADYPLDPQMRVAIVSLSTVTGVTFTADGFRDLSATPAAFSFTVCNTNLETSRRRVTVSVAGTTSVTKETEGCPDGL